LTESSTPDRLATGELNERLRPGRILRQPGWLVNDLAPMRAELRRPVTFVRGVALWARVRQHGFTMLACRRARTLFRLAAEAERRAVPGALVDCGVWNGGSTAIMAAAAPPRRRAAAPPREAWAFDSFQGLPAPGPRDGARATPWEASCVGREENVVEAFRRFARQEQLRVVKGWFEDTLPTHANAISQIDSYRQSSDTRTEAYQSPSTT
jgi:hypothetical protein